MTLTTAIVLGATAIPAGAGSSISVAPQIEPGLGVDLVPAGWREENWDNRDCHRYADRHFIPGYGRTLHRHHGKRCGVDVLRRSSDRRGHRDRGEDCIRIGDIKICT
jgi:hypothetical protein